METVRALVDAGLLVAAYQRGETFDIPEMFHDDIEEMGWDVIDVTTIEKVLESNPFEAIVCTVGKPLSLARDSMFRLLTPMWLLRVEINHF